MTQLAFAAFSESRSTAIHERVRIEVRALGLALAYVLLAFALAMPSTQLPLAHQYYQTCNKVATVYKLVYKPADKPVYKPVYKPVCKPTSITHTRCFSSISTTTTLP